MSVAVKRQLRPPSTYLGAGRVGPPSPKIQISGKRAHARAHRDAWRCEDPGKRRKAVKAGRKTQGTVECFPRIAVVPVGGGRPQSVSTTYPDVSRLSPLGVGSRSARPSDCLHVAVAVRLRPGDRRAAVDCCRWCRRDGRFPRLSPDPRHGRYAPSDRGLRAPCTRRPRLTRSHDPGF